jgi:hypothetical protein
MWRAVVRLRRSGAKDTEGRAAAPARARAIGRGLGAPRSPAPFSFPGTGVRGVAPGKSPRGWSAERRSLSQSAPFGAGALFAQRARASRRSIAAIWRAGRNLHTDPGPRLPPEANLAPVVQLAPSAPVIVPVGRGPGASRACACEAQSRAPHPAPPTERLRKAPSVSGVAI